MSSPCVEVPDCPNDCEGIAVGLTLAQHCLRLGSSELCQNGATVARHMTECNKRVCRSVSNITSVNFAPYAMLIGESVVFEDFTAAWDGVCDA